MMSATGEGYHRRKAAPPLLFYFYLFAPPIPLPLPRGGKIRVEKRT